MRKELQETLEALIAGHCRSRDIAPLWHAPLLRYADAGSPHFRRLRELVLPDHYMPEDFLDNPRVVVSYFLPFITPVAASNLAAGADASPEWAEAYLTTNAMADELNHGLAAFLREKGFRAAVPTNIGFTPEILKSRWSQRHVAWIAGHGTFGINNMLIGDNGCCGRYFSIVSDVPIEPDSPLQEERCLYKAKGTCGVCVRRCPSGALTFDGFDRRICWAVCSRNGERFPGAEVCGKCVVGLPCAFKTP